MTFDAKSNNETEQKKESIQIGRNVQSCLMLIEYNAAQLIELNPRLAGINIVFLDKQGKLVGGRQIVNKKRISPIITPDNAKLN